MLEIYQEMVKIISKGERAVLATIISSHGATPRKAGAKMLIKEDGTFLGTVGGGGTEHKIRQTVSEIMRSGKPQVVSFDLSGKDGTLAMICGGQMEIFLEPVMPPDTLYLFGAGPTSQRTATLYTRRGFRVVLIEPRPAVHRPDRFPHSESPFAGE